MDNDALQPQLEMDGFNDVNLKMLNDFIHAFENLNAVGSKTFKPAGGGGLAEFNESLKQTNTLLAQMNANLEAVKNGASGLSSSTDKAASSAKKLTAEQAATKVEIQEANKATMDFARNSNQAYTDRIEQEKKARAQTKLSNQTLTIAMADQKVQTKEMNDIRIKNAQENNQLYQDRIARDAEAAKQKKIDNQRITEDEAKQIVQIKEENRIKIEAEQQDNQLFKDRIAREEAESDAKKKKAKEDREAEATRKKNDKDVIASSDHLLQLKKRADEAAKAYANSVRDSGKGSEESKRLLKDFKDANKELNQVNVSLGRATANTSLFGGGLATAFSYVRQIAYIIPGIGIAGIFNLIGEMIMKALTALDLFSDKTEKLLDLQLRQGKSYKDQLSMLEDIEDQQDRLYQSANKWSSTSIENAGKVKAAYGTTEIKALKNEIEATTTAQAELLRKINDVGSKKGLFDQQNKTVETLPAIIKSGKERQDRLEKQIVRLQYLTDEENDFGVLDWVANLKKRIRGVPYTKMIVKGEQITESPEVIKKQLEETQAMFNRVKTENEKNLTEYESYVKNDVAIKQGHNKLSKLTYDDSEKLALENARNEIAIAENKNSRILADDISSFEERRKAIKDLSDETIAKAEAENRNVQNSRTASDAEKTISANKLNTLRVTNEADTNDKLAKLTEQFRQRMLSAQLKIDSDAVDASAIANERVYKNEQLGLQNRLNAYQKYIDLKQELQDLQFTREVDTRASLAEGKVPEIEMQSMISNRIKQKASIQADVENQVFTITKQYYDKQVKELELRIYAEDRVQLNAYTKEINDLNNQYAKKEISYKKYKESIESISKRYDTKTIEERFVESKKDLGELKADETSKVISLAKNRAALEAAKDNYAIALKTGDKEKIQDAKQILDTYKGAVNATTVVVEEAGKKTEQAQKTVEENALALAKSRQVEIDEKEKKEKEKRKERFDAIKQMEQALYDTTKEIVDRRFEEKARRLEEENALIQKNLDVQLDAVNKSSLSEKEKHALDAQLSAEKNERDRQAANEQKKIKHDQAIFDKKLAMMHIVFSTATAVAALIETPWLAVAAGVAGAAELATVATQEIPAYKEGTPGHRGGLARFGEAGVELVNEPYRSPYLVYQDTIGFLPKGTEIIPISDSPSFNGRESTGWEQTKWLAKQLRPQKEKAKTVNIINIDLDFERHKRRVLGN